MKSTEMLIEIAENQEKVYEKGVDKGYEGGHKDGYKVGLDAGIVEGYENGQNAVYAEIAPLNTELETTLNGGDTGYKSYYHEFWDTFQNYGNKRNYINTFSNNSGSWEYITFKPKYDIICEGDARQCFYAWENLKESVNIGAILKEQGVTIDTSRATNLTGFFGYGSSLIGELPVISCENAGANTVSLFRGTKVTKIEKVIVTELTDYTSMFIYCSLLEDIAFEGTIANSIAFSHSIKLSKASIENIINHLSNTTSGLTVTLSQTAVNNAFTTEEWEALIATKPNWTISLV